MYYEARASSGPKSDHNTSLDQINPTREGADLPDDGVVIQNDFRRLTSRNANAPDMIASATEGAKPIPRDKETLSQPNVAACKTDAPSLQSAGPVPSSRLALLAPPPLADAEPSEEDIERQCDQLFHEAPIKFKCRPGNKFDETI